MTCSVCGQRLLRTTVFYNTAGRAMCQNCFRQELRGIQGFQQSHFQQSQRRERNVGGSGWSDTRTAEGIRTSIGRRMGESVNRILEENGVAIPAVQLKGTADFIKQLESWRGNQTALYKLSAPYEDYEFVAVNSLIQSSGKFLKRTEFKYDEQTAIFGALPNGEVPEDVAELFQTNNLSHTESLAAMGYSLVLSVENEAAIIDKWAMTGTHRHASGSRVEYIVIRYANDLWSCACPPFQSNSKPCQHIKKKQEEIIKSGGTVTQKSSPEPVNPTRAIRLED